MPLTLPEIYLSVKNVEGLDLTPRIHETRRANDVNREAELQAPSGVVSSVLLADSRLFTLVGLPYLAAENSSQ